MCAPLFVLRMHLRRSRVNEFFLIVLSLLMATGAAAVSDGLMPLAMARVKAVREFRIKSKSKPTGNR